MATVLVVTHPEVLVEPATPVPQWRLSARGVDRMRVFASSPPVAAVRSIWCSNETKALDAAAVLAAELSAPVRTEADLHENDRSATGYLPPDQFEAMADAFFTRPEEGVRGWERAVDAQARMVAAVHRILATAPAGDVAIVTHGAVGTLLLCKMLGEPISRARDQAHQGCYWSFDRETGRVLHPWRSVAPR